MARAVYRSNKLRYGEKQCQSLAAIALDFLEQKFFLLNFQIYECFRTCPKTKQTRRYSDIENRDIARKNIAKKLHLKILLKIKFETFTDL